MTDVGPVVLVHGGLAEQIGAQRFWVGPGIVERLVAHGRTVIARDRDTTPVSWAASAAEVSRWFDGSVTLVGASNGVASCVRLALTEPARVARLVLLWPAGAGDADVDAGYGPEARHLLDGETLRGVTDAELGTLTMPVAVMAAQPENRAHPHLVVERVVELAPHAIRIEPGFPESPSPDFAPHVDHFVEVMLPHL